MRLQSRCALVVAAAGMALPLFSAAVAEAGAPIWFVVSRNSLTAAPGAGSYNGTVPGIPAAQQSLADSFGVKFSWKFQSVGAQGHPSTAVIDAAGNVSFAGTLMPLSYTDNDFNTQFLVNTSNQVAVFQSSGASGWSSTSIVARDGSASSPTISTTSTAALQGGPTPSNPNNWILNSASGGNGLNVASVNVNPNGTMLFASSLFGSGATSTNNAAFFTGAAGSASQAYIARSSAPGTTGALFSNTSLPNNFNQVNASGKVAFNSTLVADPNAGTTDVSTTGTTQNDSGLWILSPSGGTLVARRNDSPGYLNGAAYGAFSAGAQGNTMNTSGNMVFTNTLSTTQGSVPATSSNNASITAYVGGSLSLVARSGTTVPTAINGNTESYATSGAFSYHGNDNVCGNNWNNNNRLVHNAKFAPSANITAGTNDTALMTWQGGTSSVLYQTGVTPVPNGPSGATTFTSIGGNSALNNQDHVGFTGVMAATGSVTGTTNNGLWLLPNIANPASATLVAQGGMAAPGVPGFSFGNGFSALIMNNNDTMVFSNTLSNGSTTMASIWAYNPAWGLLNVINAGDNVLLRGPNQNQLVSSFGYSLISNGSGGTSSLNDSDQLVLALQSTSPYTNTTIVVVQLPAPGAASLGLVGLAAFARRRRR